MEESSNLLLEQAQAYYVARKYEQAIQCCDQVLNQEPKNDSALVLLGLVLNAISEFEKAVEIFHQALEINPNNISIYYPLSSALFKLRRINEAAQALRLHNRYHVEDIESKILLGAYYMIDKQYIEAIAVYEDILSRDDSVDNVHFSLGLCYSNIGSDAKAVNFYKQALEKDPTSLGAYLNLANIYNEQGKSDAAVELLEQALEYHRDKESLIYSLGMSHFFSGQFEESKRYLKKTLTINPKHAHALAKLIALEENALDYSELEAKANALLNDDVVNPEGKAALEFALAQTLERKKLYAEAFEHYRLGNELKKRYQARDESYNIMLANAIAGIFDENCLDRKMSLVGTKEKPIFIVGMPRAGTTLLYSKLMAHQGVRGVGEHNAMHLLACHAGQYVGVEVDYPEVMQVAPMDKLKEMAQYYLDEVGYFEDDRYTLDKNNLNFFHVGLIASLLPKAKIIHCRRNPVDTCLSCYFQNFSMSTMYFTNDLQDLAKMYKAYSLLMQHWHQVLPGFIYDVDYEALVEDSDRVLSGIYHYLELDGEKVSNTEIGSINTASTWQARQPIYQSSVEKWRHYEAYIQPLLAELGA